VESGKAGGDERVGMARAGGAGSQVQASYGMRAGEDSMVKSGAFAGDGRLVATAGGHGTRLGCNAVSKRVS
jgi:hypothetical protein